MAYLSETTSFLSGQTKHSVISGFLIKRVSVERGSIVFINYYEYRHSCRLAMDNSNAQVFGV